MCVPIPPLSRCGTFCLSLNFLFLRDSCTTMGQMCTCEYGWGCKRQKDQDYLGWCGWEIFEWEVQWVENVLVGTAQVVILLQACGGSRGVRIASRLVSMCSGRVVRGYDFGWKIRHSEPKRVGIVLGLPWWGVRVMGIIVRVMGIIKFLWGSWFFHGAPWYGFNLLFSLAYP